MTLLRAAAETFEVSADAGSGARIYMPLKSSVLILDDGWQRIVLLSSHFMTHLRVSVLFRQRVAQTIGVPLDHVLLFSSHNHCCPPVAPLVVAPGKDQPDLKELNDSLTPEGRRILAGYVAAASRIVGRLVPVRLHYGVGRERRITHHRKGWLADGTTYFMREEDRLKLAPDYVGGIDDEAFVLSFVGENDKPVGFLTQFTGHPVTAHRCDISVVHGEYPQIACDVLSNAYDGVPVLFLQGCAGDVNSKGLLADKPLADCVRDAQRHGRLLGETFVGASRRMTLSRRADLDVCWQEVELPFEPVPPREALQRRLEHVETFLKRCDEGDQLTTRECDGLNFPINMSLSNRKTYVEPVRRWLCWALQFHSPEQSAPPPTGVRLEMAAFRIGDVGIVGIPAEPFMAIGRQIKRRSPLAVTVPCGYMNDAWVGYIPDADNCRDLDYISGYYRYSTELFAYRPPAGDALAAAAVRMLADLSGSTSP